MHTGGISGALPSKAAYATITAPLHFPKILRVILQKLLDGSSIAAYSSALKSLNPRILRLNLPVMLGASLLQQTCAWVGWICLRSLQEPGYPLLLYCLVIKNASFRRYCQRNADKARPRFHFFVFKLIQHFPWIVFEIRLDDTDTSQQSRVWLYSR